MTQSYNSRKAKNSLLKFKSPKVFGALLLFLFVFNFKVNAQNNRLTVGSFNDNWGGSFTQVKDNYRSYGILSEYAFLFRNNSANFNLIYSGFTDRFAPDSTRLDELEIYLKLPVKRLNKHLVLNAIAGSFVSGNLGGQSLQNNIHGGVGVPALELPYSSSNGINPFFGGGLQADFALSKTNQSATLYLEPKAHYYWSPGYLQSVKVNASLVYKNAASDQIKIELGYNHQDVFFNPTRQAVAQVESGFYAAYQLNLGMASFAIAAVPGRNYSTGMLGINLFNGKNRKPLKTADLLAEFGSFTKELGIYQRYLWNKITPYAKHLQLDLHQQFWSIGSQYNSNYPQQYGHFQQLSFGLNYSPIAAGPKLQVLPFVSLRAGFKTESLYSGETKQLSQNVFSLMAIAETGLRLKLPANFIHKNCYYGGTASYSYATPFYNNLKTQTENGYQFAQITQGLSFGAFVMIDL